MVFNGNNTAIPFIALLITRLAYERDLVERVNDFAHFLLHTDFGIILFRAMDLMQTSNVIEKRRLFANIIVSILKL